MQMVGAANLTRLIHPTAVIDPGAELDPSVRVGPFAVIGDRVKIGAGTSIGAHVVIEGPTEIGIGNQIFPGAAIGLETQDLKYAGGETGLKIGNYNRIREYVTINRATGDGGFTVIGDNNLLMAYVHIAHDCCIEDDVKIANATSLAGDVYIESGAVISGVLGIHQFVRIGKLAMIGGMTRIQRDVPPFTIVEGNPARVRSLNLVGMKRSNFSSSEINALKEAYRILYNSDHTLQEALNLISKAEKSAQVEHLLNFLQASSQSPRRGPIPGRLRDSAGKSAEQNRRDTES
jgi:UDP-N-acetylglucosamine acyltransferase